MKSFSLLAIFLSIFWVNADTIGYSFIDTNVCLCAHDRTQSVYWCNPLDDDTVYQFAQDSNGDCVGDITDDQPCSCAISLDANVNENLQTQSLQQPNITYQLFGTSLYGCGELVVDPNSLNGGGDGYQATYYPQATAVPAASSSSGGSGGSGSSGASGGSTIPADDEDNSNLQPDIGTTTDVTGDAATPDYDSNNPYDNTFDGGEIEGDDEDTKIKQKRQHNGVFAALEKRRLDSFEVARVIVQADLLLQASSAIPTSCLLVATDVTAVDDSTSTAPVNGVGGVGTGSQATNAPVSCTSVYSAFGASLSVCAAEPTSAEIVCGCSVFTGTLGSQYLACATAMGDTAGASSLAALIPDCSVVAEGEVSTALAAATSIAAAVTTPKAAPVVQPATTQAAPVTTPKATPAVAQTSNTAAAPVAAAQATTSASSPVATPMTAPTQTVGGAAPPTIKGLSSLTFIAFLIATFVL